MFRVFGTFGHMKRVCMAYENNSFGTSSAAMLLAVLQYLNLPTDCTFSYESDTDYSTYDYDSVARQILNAQAQVFIFFAPPAWSNPLIDAYYRLAPHGTMMFLTGSWNGNDSRDHFKAKGYNPAMLVTTQVVPHPETTEYVAAVKYRAA
eukprot:PhM_4_TR18763/c0_g2_i1/m.4303